jgi:uncharacterized protein
MYARKSPENVCPWCIADGSAAKKFDGMFLDDDPLNRAGILQSVIDEVCMRTPGYVSWQQQVWQAHCGDACEFHGDATREEIESLDDQAIAHFIEHEGLKPQHWPLVRDNYVPGGDTSIFKFVCRKCQLPVYTFDLS